MSVWFTSDLHLGHPFIARKRGFNVGENQYHYNPAGLDEHDNMILDNLQGALPKRCKLFVLGDVGWHPSTVRRLTGIGGKHVVKVVLLGNHDKKGAKWYLEAGFNDVIGFHKYRDFWLSHCPIHPQEIFRARGNIHGHIHVTGTTPNLFFPYYNVNVEYQNYMPVPFERIDEAFKEMNL